MPRKDSIDIGELTDSAFYIISSVIEEKHGYFFGVEGVILLKSKYVMIKGLAFSEESDMEKLKKICKYGYLLEYVI